MSSAHHFKDALHVCKCFMKYLKQFLSYRVDMAISQKPLFSFSTEHSPQNKKYTTIQQ